MSTSSVKQVVNKFKYCQALSASPVVGGIVGGIVEEIFGGRNLGGKNFWREEIFGGSNLGGKKSWGEEILGGRGKKSLEEKPKEGKWEIYIENFEGYVSRARITRLDTLTELYRFGH